MPPVENPEGDPAVEAQADPEANPPADAAPVDAVPTPDPADVTAFEEDDDPESLVGEEVPDGE